MNRSLLVLFVGLIVSGGRGNAGCVRAIDKSSYLASLPYLRRAVRPSFFIGTVESIPDFAAAASTGSFCASRHSRLTCRSLETARKYLRDRRLPSEMRQKAAERPSTIKVFFDLYGVSIPRTREF